MIGWVTSSSKNRHFEIEVYVGIYLRLTYFSTLVSTRPTSSSSTFCPVTDKTEGLSLRILSCLVLNFGNVILWWLKVPIKFTTQFTYRFNNFYRFASKVDINRPQGNQEARGSSIELLQRCVTSTKWLRVMVEWTFSDRRESEKPGKETKIFKMRL